MGFSEKAKAYFYGELGLDNRGISKIMDNYSESLVSRYINQDKISPTFILKLKKHFPDADVDSWIDLDQNTGTANESPTTYQIDPVKRINRMIKDLEELKSLIKKEFPKE